MSDEQFDDPGPVAEYRDPELASRFRSDPVPDHRPGFWSDLEAAIDGSRPGDITDLSAPVPPLTPTSTTTLTSTPTLTPSTAPAAGAGRRLWLAAAAALLVAGVGATALLAGGRSASPLESAAPTPTSASASQASASSSASSLSTTWSTADPSSTTTTALPGPMTTNPAGIGPDYFNAEVRVKAIGRGEVVGFSSDDSTVLVVDDGPGTVIGCEGAEVLALYAQDLLTGERQLAFDGAAVETGGLSLLISPFDASPPQVATQPVYWSDWCDGSQGSVYRGVLGADGLITMIEPVESGGDDDPFAGLFDASGQDGGDRSPDGTKSLLVADGTAEVVSVDGGTKSTWQLPADLTPETILSGRWSPAGDVVALGTPSALIIWNPDSGEHRRFDTGPVLGLSFANDVRRLAVVSLDGVAPVSTILSFGDSPDPVPASPRCSGAVELAPLDSALADRAMPAEVAATALAIDQAASVCDWAALDQLTAKAFTASFGGDDPATLWPAEEAAGGSPMWYLRTLLRLPPAVDGAIGDPIDPARWVWPALHLSDDCQLAIAEQTAMTAAGYDVDRVVSDCQAFGGYVGYRTAIDETGAWRFFVAGD